MKTIVIVFALFVLCAQAVFAQTNQTIHLIESNGTTYEVIEVKSHYHDRNKFQKFIHFGGRKLLVLKLYKSDWTLTMPEDEIPKEVRKDIPDYRDESERAPVKHWLKNTAPQVVLTALQWALQ